jgi:hypothetical protein
VKSIVISWKLPRLSGLDLQPKAVVVRFDSRIFGLGSGQLKSQSRVHFTMIAAELPGSIYHLIRAARYGSKNDTQWWRRNVSFVGI